MPLKVTKLHFAPNNCKVNNSRSINKFAAKEVQMSDSMECEHSEQLSSIKPIMALSQIIHLITLNLERKHKFQSINTTCARITRYKSLHSK